MKRPEQTAARRERSNHNLVDVDATIADDDDTSEDDAREREERQLAWKQSGLAAKGGQGTKPAAVRDRTTSGEPLLGENLLGDSAPPASTGSEKSSSFLRGISPRHMLRKSNQGLSGVIKPKHRRTNTGTSVSSGNSRETSGTGNSAPSPARASKDSRAAPGGGPAADRFLAVSALADTTNLLTLIQSQSWHAVAARCDSQPREASETLTTAVRGGYNARVSPLHLACERTGVPLDAMEALIEACPQHVERKKSPGGQLPLHAACTWGATSDVIGYLLAAYPAAAKVRDDLGNLPLHCACFSGSDEITVESLLCTFPNAVWARNGQGSAPADITRRLRHPNRRAVLDLLERRSLDAVRDRSAAGHGGGGQGSHGGRAPVQPHPEQAPVPSGVNGHHGNGDAAASAGERHHSRPAQDDQKGQQHGLLAHARKGSRDRLRDRGEKKEELAVVTKNDSSKDEDKGAEADDGDDGMLWI